ncbi:MAG: imidazole glycerol phosphate synthase subunit HisH [Hyphomicrobiaceae bacterium]|nr:imidazole glycerol phosphate synthase subunit HisH [Hyphomicrobiaceae bacterium]
MITIVDYGLGNIRAFQNMYKRMGVETRSARTADELCNAERIVLPGVGAFDHAMELLDASGMRGTLDELVLGHSVPILGVCVGMQILAESSEEGVRKGLGWIKGSVRHFKSEPATNGLPLPHMGWNDVTTAEADPLFNSLETGSRFYFLHSYYFECAQPQEVTARAQYGANFTCAVKSGKIRGVQFHPEKSHHYGAQLLKNFADN